MPAYKFVDLFSGCGGLSLGLAMAGLDGQFAIERDPMAFSTFSANFLGERELPVNKFSWPSWLQKKAWSIDDLLAQHGEQLVALEGCVEILAGGPPCQGFSFAGKRNAADPRNQLFEKYVEVVRAIKPAALILENVPGMKVAHSKKRVSTGGGDNSTESYYEKLKRSLEEIGYEVHGELVNAAQFGVPQKRSRLIVIGLRSDIARSFDCGVMFAFKQLEQERKRQLQDLELPEPVPVCEALSDLTTARNTRKPCIDPFSPKGFEEIEYDKPLTKYQELMHGDCSAVEMDSMRLARHRDVVRDRFTKILQECPRGVRMNEANREQYSTKKHRIYPMDPWAPAPTITTLPDDVLHYSEPRILTVRESARLQSFPDWFLFRGKYTTGGVLRTKECPRYTQVGNAVPPLLARAIGLTIRAVLDIAKEAVESKIGQVDGEEAHFEEIAVA